MWPDTWFDQRDIIIEGEARQMMYVYLYALGASLAVNICFVVIVLPVFVSEIVDQCKRESSPNGPTEGREGSSPTMESGLSLHRLRNTSLV